MNQTDWIGFIGVTVLLLAYLLNLFNKLKRDDVAYLIMNLMGAGLACYASVLLRYIPFIILEGCWTIVSMVVLIKFLVSK